MAEQQYDFEEIRCFDDADVPTKLWPLIKRPEIEAFVKGAFPDIDYAKFSAQVGQMTTIRDFQANVVAKLVLSIAQKSTDSLELRGIENVNVDNPGIFITNHRDIVLDSAFLCSMLASKGFPTAEIAIGDNLFAYDWIKDLVRLNRSFVVMRSVPVRQMLEVSKRLSSYIRYAVREKKDFVWIAQREGRSKDCSDKTQASVIKMLSLGGPSKDIIQNIRDLNLMPVALSYEFDPCDFLKAQEFQLKRDNPEWKKSKADDVLSMKTGILGYKGRVVFTITKCMNPIFDTYPWIQDRNAQVNCVCQTIDRALHANMELFPVNYVAYDMRFQTNKYADKYTKEEKNRALEYLNGQLAKVQIPNRDDQFLWEQLLIMYSNPVVNRENLEHQSDSTALPMT